MHVKMYEEYKIQSNVIVGCIESEYSEINHTHYYGIAISMFIAIATMIAIAIARL